jgi:hypothetical protein
MAIQIPQFTLGLAATTLNSGATASANTAAVDMNVAGCDGAVFHIQCGTHAAAASAVTIKLQESDDNSAWVDVSGASVVATGNTAQNGTSVVFATKRTGRRRYVRLNLVQANAQNYVITYIAAAGLNATANDPITPALYTVLA